MGRCRRSDWQPTGARLPVLRPRGTDRPRTVRAAVAGLPETRVSDRSRRELRTARTDRVLERPELAVDLERARVEDGRLIRALRIVDAAVARQLRIIVGA